MNLKLKPYYYTQLLTGTWRPSLLLVHSLSASSTVTLVFPLSLSISLFLFIRFSNSEFHFSAVTVDALSDDRANHTYGKLLVTNRFSQISQFRASQFNSIQFIYCWYFFCIRDWYSVPCSFSRRHRLLKTTLPNRKELQRRQPQLPAKAFGRKVRWHSCKA